MARKTKEQKEIEENKEVKTKESNKKTSNKESSSEPKLTKKNTKTASKEIPKKTTKNTTSKPASKTNSTSSKKTKSTSKKSSVSPRRTKKTTQKSEQQETKKAKANIVEYYDLPYRYNQTVVKLLAQTPTTLFVYWDISDTDKNNLLEQYGYDFFEKTRPILIIHNDTMNYSFEVEINDFANSWYLHVNDSNCNYRIELGRKPVYNYIQNKNLPKEILEDKNSYVNKYPSKPLDKDYFYITTSNSLESPNDHILFDSFSNNSIEIRNIKTNNQYTKSITSMKFRKNINKIYNIYDLYKDLYEKENIEDIYDFSNPSSNSLSSKFK